MWFVGLVSLFIQHSHLPYPFHPLLFFLYVDHLATAYSPALCPSFALLNMILRYNEHGTEFEDKKRNLVTFLSYSKVYSSMCPLTVLSFIVLNYERG